MRLPDSVYQQVLQALGLDEGGLLDRRGEDAPAEPPASENKRRSFRRRLNTSVEYYRHGAVYAKPQTCTLVDLSRDGVGVFTDAVVAPGERFVLHLPRADDDGEVGVLALLCTARSSRLKSNGRFRTGAEFTDPAEVEAEQAGLAVAADGLSARVSAGSAGTRVAEAPAQRIAATRTRRSSRREAAGYATFHVYRDDGNHGEHETVQLRDYSESGVAVLRNEPLKVGDQFVVRIPREGEAPLTRLCRVVNVVVAADRHRIGAEFIPFPGPRGRGFMARLREWIG
jgi:hypothetical protein